LTNIGTFDQGHQVTLVLVIVSPPLDDGRSGTKLDRVLAHIHQNSTNNISLSTLARIAGFTPHHFSAFFTKATGLSPHQYVLRERIERAKSYLEDDAHSILQVSMLTGFRTQGHFAKVFRRLVGTTPSGFREALREKARLDDGS
jgi:AraC family transcriptional regulator